MLMKKLFTLIAAALFAGSVSAENVSIWKNDGSIGVVDWGNVNCRFAPENNKTGEECYAFPLDVWEKIKTLPIHLTVKGDDTGWPMIRVTNGWWSVNFLPGEEAFDKNNELLVDNGDGTYGLTINLADNPDLVASLDEKHLLFTGGGYSLEELFLVEEGEGGGDLDLGAFTANDLDVSFSTPNVIADPTNASNHCVVISAGANAENEWDAQLFISVPAEMAFKEGDVIGLKMTVMAEKAQENAGIQLHKAPGDYLYWAGPAPVNFTTEWAQYDGTCTIDASGVGAYTLAFNLSMKGGEANKLYFDNIVLTVNGEPVVSNNFETTGIVDAVAKPVVNNVIYNLAGQKVDKNYKGIVIMNGKKYIQK